MKIQINEFKGILPKLANDKLPNNMAQIASDLKTASGELVAIKASTADVGLPDMAYKSLFQYNEGSNTNWVYTDDINHWANAPVADDTFERMYYTGTAGVAAVGTITFSDAITDGETVTINEDTFEFDIAEDGVGAGNVVTGDMLTTTGILAGAALATAFAGETDSNYGLTDNLDGTVTITAVTAGIEGNIIVLSKSGAQIAVDGSGFLGGTTAGESSYRAFANDIDSSPWDFTTDYYCPGGYAGIAPTISATVAGATYLAYYYTYVSRYGEEGPGSAIAELADQTVGNIVHVDGIPLPPAGAALLTAVGTARPKVRIYRTADDGAGGSAFLLVCEADYFADDQIYAVGDYVIYAEDLYECTVAGTGSWAGGTHTFVQGDNEAVADLGSASDSYLWDRAPLDIINLRSHPNGFFVASKGKSLHFTEAFAPWAWPEDFQIPLPANIIGLGVYGSTIVVATDANIYTFSGPHPTSLYKQKLSFQPCLSQRAVVETDSGVMFPSKEGFQLVNQNGPQNVTADMFAPEDWDDFELDTMHGVWYNKAYYGFFSDVTEGNIRIDFLNQSITTGADYHWAAHVAVSDGIFRTIFASDITSSALNISQWDADPVRYRSYQYKSPRYILEKPVNFKVAQVILDTDFYNTVIGVVEEDSTLSDLNTTEWATGLIDAPLNGAAINVQDLNGDGLYSLSSLGVQSYVDFNVYVDSVLKFTKQVSNSTMFKLPRGFKDKKWEIEIIGMIPVKRVTMATSTEEIV